MTASIRKGGVYLVNFDHTVGAEAKKIRPALVVSNDINNAHSPIISISPISSNVLRIYSFEVEIPVGNAGLKLPSKLMINQTRAVDKARLIKKMGRVTPAIINQVNRALKLHYGL